MDPARIVYRDVTQVVEAGSRANHAPELRAALAALGFERVGVLEARLGHSPAAEPLGHYLANSDAQLVMRVIAEGELAEVLASADHSTFAVVERWFGGPLVCLYTLVEDGVVVETSMKPARPPEFGPAAPRIPLFREGDVAGWIVALLVKAAGGTPPLWMHEDWPRAGYHLALIETRDAAALWRQHRRRVEQRMQRDPVSIRPHDTLLLYLCIRHRARQIARQKARWQERLSRAILLLFFALVVATVLSAGRIFAGLSSLGSLALFVPILFMAAAGSLALLVTGFLRSAVVPRLPGPRLQPVPKLLLEVEAAYPLGGQAARPI